MESIRPVTADVLFKYICPGCEADHWATQKETRLVGKILCSCGTLLKLAPITHVKLTPTFGNFVPFRRIVTNKVMKPELEVAKVSQDDRLVEVMAALVRLGYLMKEAKSLAASAIRELPQATSEELLTRAMDIRIGIKS